MDVDPQPEPISQPQEGSKRTLRTAVEGSPARPDAKCVRASEFGREPDARTTTSATDANLPILTRFLTIIVISHAPHTFASNLIGRAYR